MVLFLNELPEVDHRVQAVLRRLLEDGEHCHHQIKPQEHKGLHPTSNLILYNAVPRSANTIAVAGLFAAKARAVSLAVGSDQWVRIVGGGLKGGHFGGPTAPVRARHFRPVGGVKDARKCAGGLALTPLTQAGTE